MRARLHISQAGPQTTLQDLGRRGGQFYGFSQSGAADEYSFRWANKLLGNPKHCAALEITLGPFTCEFEEDAFIAITGAKGKITIDGTALPPWQSCFVGAGQQLQFSIANSGVHYYLAVHKGFSLPLEQTALFESMAMVPREQSGPFNGGPIKCNHSLYYLPQSKLAKPTARDYYQSLQSRLVPWQLVPDYTEELSLSLIESYQHKRMTEQQRETLYNSAYTISTDSNKMGYRLQGAEINIKETQLLSEGLALGAVQIPASGQPIILLRDRQTTGGYPKVGCISQLDAFQLSQRRPGQIVRFQKTRLEEAISELQEYWEFFS